MPSAARENVMCSTLDRSKEPIDWDADYLKSIEGKVPSAKYGALSESLRHAIPEKTTCSLFCGGRKCKYCNPHHWKDEEMEIKGLYSSWVTENILATSRPTLDAVDNFNVIGQFKKAGINSIINLQTGGEHASCGNPLDVSGFSYNPQQFMDNDVFFYNFGWPDYDVGSLANILDMVKVMQFALSEGKVAIHCHAGLGRTGVLISCYLVFANRMDPNEVIHFVRSKRKGAIQTRSQVSCIQEFGQYLKPLRVVFSDVADDSYDFTLTQFLIRQKHMLHGQEARTLKNIPKIVYIICERLLQLAKKGRPTVYDITAKTSRIDSRTLLLETAPSAFNNHPSGSVRPGQNSSSMHSSPSTPNLLGLPSGPDRSRSMELLPLSPRSAKAAGSTTPEVHSKHARRSPAMENGSDSEPERSTSKKKRKSKKMENGHAGSDEYHPAMEAVLRALTQMEYDDDTLDRGEKLKKTLNSDNASWSILREEDDAIVLAKLMWDWLDHLKEPVLSAQDLPNMLNHCDDPEVGLSRLSKGAKCVVDYLIGVLDHLRPLPDQLEVELIQRILSTLTHQHMDLESTDVTLSQQSTVSRRTTNSGEMNANMVLRLMQFFYRRLNGEKGDGTSPEGSFSP